MDECKNCGLPMGSHVSLRATWTERHGWDGGSPSVLVCPSATYQATPPPSTPDLDDLLPNPEPKLAGGGS